MRGRVYLGPQGAIEWGVTPGRGGADSFGCPETLEGLRPTESTPPCQGVLKWLRVFPSCPPTPSTEGRGAALPRRFSGPAAGYARRNHLMYSGVARTTSPFSVVVVVYVSRGGELKPSGRLPNASRSSRSFRFSRLCVGVGVPFGGSGAPIYREQSLGLYVALPVLKTSAPVDEIGKEVTQHVPPRLFRMDLGCTGSRLDRGSNPIHIRRGR